MVRAHEDYVDPVRLDVAHGYGHVYVYLLGFELLVCLAYKPRQAGAQERVAVIHSYLYHLYCSVWSGYCGNLSSLGD